MTHPHMTKAVTSCVATLVAAPTSILRNRVERMRLLPVDKVLTIALIVTGCLPAGLPVTPRAWAADADYQVIQEPDASYSPIIGLISAANRSVRMTVYELSDPATVEALVDAHRRGVDSKVILDAAFHGRTTNATAFKELSDAGVGVK